jgi:serine/threonine protein phosphatase PrpC
MPGLEQSLASNEGKSDEEMQSTGLSFIAPASEELGGEINVAVLANGIGREDDALEGLVIEAIRQSFLSSATTDAFRAISTALKKANAAVRARRPAQSGSGCSATIALVAGDRLFVGNVGDNRVYLFREGETETLAADYTWVQEALQSWRVKPGEIQDHPGADFPGQYLGKDEGITPRLAPIEFLWPGDILLLCTAGLGRLRDNEIHDIVTSSSSGDAARKLVQAAQERGADGNLTSLILRVPQEAGAFDVMPTPGRRWIGISPVAIGLVLANLLLICLVAGVLVRGSSFLSPAQPIEVAKPAFIVTATATATPTPGLDVGTAELTPTVPASSPVAAPTLAPAPSATPLPAPTFTPQPAPTTWTVPAPPALLLPADGTFFNGSQSDVILEWGSAGSMPEDIFYVVSIKKWVNGNYVGESMNWTKSNRIRLDPSFYTAFDSGPQRFANAAPDLAGAVDQFEWSVAIYRLTLIKPDGTLQGVPLSPAPSVRRFSWGPPLPTRVYGG